MGLNFKMGHVFYWKIVWFQSCFTAAETNMEGVSSQRNVNDAESYILTLQFLKLAVVGIIAF